MTPHPLVGRRGPSWLAAAAAILALVAGPACGGGADGSAGAGLTSSDDPNPPTTTTPAPTAPTPTTTAPPTTPTTAPPPPAETEAAPPVRVVIPRIGVDAPIVALGLDATGALAAPAGADDAGWWQAGPEPGETGPAVIAGHVDSRRRPAVFHRLKDLVPGDTVDVRRADGSTATFVVERTEQHPKAAFPTATVYGDTSGPALRLITCGGVFDRSTRHYVENVIVFATGR